MAAPLILEDGDRDTITPSTLVFRPVREDEEDVTGTFIAVTSLGVMPVILLTREQTMNLKNFLESILKEQHN